jgi:hypothetical protein
VTWPEPNCPAGCCENNAHDVIRTIAVLKKRSRTNDSRFIGQQ